MEGQVPENPFQDTTARAGDSLCLTRKWYFSKQEIEHHSPSRKDGIEYEQESELRKFYCSFLQELGMELKVPQLTIATAMMLCHRFYMRQSHAKNDWQTVGIASMFLACKAEETPRWLSDVAIVAYKLMFKWDPSASRRIKQRDVYDKQKELILSGERLLLATVAFDLNIEHPYKPLVAALKRLEISNKKLVNVAWNFVNDWLRTTVCLQYKPHYVAAGSLLLAAKSQGLKLPTEKGMVWWMQFDVSPKQLEEVIQHMFGMLENNGKQAQPPMRGKVTESKPAVTNGSNVSQHVGHVAKADAGEFVKSATSNSPQSCVLSGSNAADNTDHGATVTSGPVKSVVSTCKSKPAVGKAMSTIPQPAVTNGSNVSQHVGHVAKADAGEFVKSATSNSPQSCVLSGSNAADNTDHGATVTSGGPVKSAVSTCTTNVACSDICVGVKEGLWSQTSDCGSAISVVEDGDGEPKADQNSSSKVVSVQGCDSKIDVDRIRKALKRRRGERVVDKKVVEARDDEIDGESWIERELENGIELDTASADKRRRL